MRFSLRTLLAITTLAAIVAASFAVNIIAGIFAYLACFTVFMLTWRMRLVCRQIDKQPQSDDDPYLAWRLLFEAVVLGLTASMAFCGGCALIQLPVTPIMTTPESYRAIEWQMHKTLLVSIPVGTFAALLVYWISWPTVK